MINFWLNYKEEIAAKESINYLLAKFVGRSIDPIDKLIASMRKAVFKYFKKNPEKIRFFDLNYKPIDYYFDITEHNGIIVKVEFVA